MSFRFLDNWDICEKPLLSCEEREVFLKRLHIIVHSLEGTRDGDNIEHIHRSSKQERNFSKIPSKIEKIYIFLENIASFSCRECSVMNVFYSSKKCRI